MSQALPYGLQLLGARTVDEIRDAQLRDLVNAAASYGRPAPDVSPGSFDYIRASILAQQISLVEANALYMREQVSARNLTGTALEERVRTVGIERRTKAGSIGPIVFVVAAASSPVAQGAELTSTSGLRFRVTIGGVKANGDSIEVAAIDTGRQTNLEEGTILQWVAAPPYADPKVPVGPGGLVNGVEDETDAELLERYLAHLRNPPAESNPQALAERAEKSHPSVQKAFVYSALHGPGTYTLAVTASPTESNRSRVVNDTIVTNVVAPAVAGTHLDTIYPHIVSAWDQPVYQLSIGLSLPSARSASPPGPGGGWVNGQPWPLPTLLNNSYPAVTQVVDPITYEVATDAAPLPSVTRISWLSPDTWELHTATVVATLPVAGGHRITVDREFPGITIGALIWPACERQDTYVAAILQAFAMMGPGEMTNQAPVLVRSARHPRPFESWPYSLADRQMRYLTNSGTEVLSARIVNATLRTPAISGAAPAILVPQHIGFYPG